MNIWKEWEWCWSDSVLNLYIRRGFGIALLVSYGIPRWRVQVALGCLHVVFDCGFDEQRRALGVRP